MLKKTSPTKQKIVPEGYVSKHSNANTDINYFG